MSISGVLDVSKSRLNALMMLELHKKRHRGISNCLWLN